jgi:hypothetical protein
MNSYPLSRSSILWQAIQPLFALSPNTTQICTVFLSHTTTLCSRLSQTSRGSRTSWDFWLTFATGDIDCASIGRVPVWSHRRVFRKREVGLSLGDEISFALFSRLFDAVLIRLWFYGLGNRNLDGQFCVFVFCVEFEILCYWLKENWDEKRGRNSNSKKYWELAALAAMTFDPILSSTKLQLSEKGGLWSSASGESFSPDAGRGKRDDV